MNKQMNIFSATDYFITDTIILSFNYPDNN